jgi:hypothetical protein
MPEGALDNDFDEAAVPAREQLLADQPELTAPVAGGLAVDLVTRQLLFVRREVAPDLATYYDEEDFDLLNYGPHPYLPVTVDDAVLECVYIDDVGVQDLDGLCESKTYDFPAGRLAAVPIQEVWADAD